MLSLVLNAELRPQKTPLAPVKATPPTSHTRKGMTISISPPSPTTVNKEFPLNATQFHLAPASAVLRTSPVTKTRTLQHLSFNTGSVSTRQSTVDHMVPYSRHIAPTSVHYQPSSRVEQSGTKFAYLESAARMNMAKRILRQGHRHRREMVGVSALAASPLALVLGMDLFSLQEGRG